MALTIEDMFQHWVEDSDRSLVIVQSLFDNKHYDFCLFTAHLSLEKLIKVYHIKIIGKEAPKIHDLAKLLSRINFELNEEQFIFVNDVTSFHMETRYNDYKLKFYKRATFEFTTKYFNEIKEFRLWFIQKMS